MDRRTEEVSVHHQFVYNSHCMSDQMNSESMGYYFYILFAIVYFPFLLRRESEDCG